MLKRFFWNDNRFNMIALSKIYYSENGKEWSSFELDFDYDYYQVHFFEKEHIILFQNEKFILCTNDLKNMKKIKIPFADSHHRFFISGGNLFIDTNNGLKVGGEEVFAYWNFNK